MPAFLKVVALVVGGALLVIALASAGVYFLSESKLNRKLVVVPAQSLAIPTDISAIQRGQHLASAVAGCAECHGSNLAGKVYIDDRSIGRIVPPNLTRGHGGLAATFTNDDLVRAIRLGIDPTGRVLLIMPSDNYNHFGDADLGAIVAYIRSIAAIDTALPANEVRPVGRLLFAIGQLPLQRAATIDPAAPRPAVPRAGATPEYGQYLSETAGCPGCHGPGYSGGDFALAPPGTGPAPNITPAGLDQWTEADFLKAMRTGIRPDGHALKTAMPWPYYAQMTDDELRAIWRYLQVLPRRPTG